MPSKMTPELFLELLDRERQTREESIKANLDAIRKEREERMAILEASMEALRKEREKQLAYAEATRKKEEARRKEEEARRKEEEARRKEEEARRKEEEEARRKEEEARRTKEEARRKEEYEKLKAEEARETAKLRAMLDDLSRRTKATNEAINGIKTQWGRFAEEVLEPQIMPLFNAAGIEIKRVLKHYKVYRPDATRAAEIDYLLIDGDTVVLLEVKATLRRRDIEKHIERIRIVGDYRDRLPGDRKRFIGAVGGMVIEEDAERAAIKAGFYVLKQVNEQVQFANPEGFQPTVWEMG